ncbi:MAG: hypothetical protein K6U09_10775 [Acidobacteriia bacterium]|nr:hypothetical protein [Terriglobia bacterium]
MNLQRHLGLLLTLVLALGMLHCSGGSPPPPNSARPGFGNIFVVGTDAPLASVLAFQVTFTGMTVSDGTNTASLLAAPVEIEFARLHGLRTLLTLEAVPAGTYSSVTITLAAPVISFLDTSTDPPSVGTLNGRLTRSSVTVPLRTPLVVNADDLVGLFVDFRLRDSLEVGPDGQLTGTVDPRIVIRAIPPDAPDAEIDELRGGVVSVDLAERSFLLQGPHGRTLKVLTDGQTQFEEGEGLETLDSNTIVEVSGVLERSTLALRAREVLVLSRDRFLLGGLLTDVRPAPGPAEQVDLLVRTELPDLSGARIGRIATVGFDGNERFLIHHMRLPLGHLLFNRASLIEGQRISIGGALDTSTAPATLDARRVTLHPQGLEGIWLPGSTRAENTQTGVFAFRTFGLTGLLFERPVRVFTSARTRFVNLSGLDDLSGDQPIPLRIVGLVLLDHLTNEQVVLARQVLRERNE